MPGCLPAGVFSLLPGRADDRTRRRSGLLAVAKKRRSEGRFDSKGSGPSQTLFVFGRFPAGMAGGVSGRRIAVVRPGESERKDSVGTRRYGATCGHGTAFSHDGFGFRPKERTPWNMRSCIERRQFRTWPPGMAAYRRIGSPRICVWENRDRGGRLFILLKKRRIRGTVCRCMRACRRPAGGNGRQSGAIRLADNGTAGAFPNLSERHRQSGYGVGRVCGNGRSADPIPVIFPSRSGRSRRRRGLLRCN